MALELGPRRGTQVDITKRLEESGSPLTEEEVRHFETLDLAYRSLCAVLFNYVPQSGHPGGSISAGRILAALLFHTIDHDTAHPGREDADVVSFAAGHKALGLYAMWALRDEVLRHAAPGALPEQSAARLRLEDLLGFRRNPTQRTPLIAEYDVKPLDGHPTPATPFVRLATGASGVGVASSLGLALGARDAFGDDAPRVHVVEGEGGLTPGRVAEALAMAGTARLDNVVVHVDWNQASIDTDRVCRVGTQAGDYVQWTPVELFALHDWNVVFVPDGFDVRQVVAAQRVATGLNTGQPTAVVYSTIKGWRYGIEGKASHGAGHGLCTDGFFDAMAPLLQRYDESLPTCADLNQRRCAGPCGAEVLEECLWQALLAVRRVVEREDATARYFADRLQASRRRLDERGRQPRPGAPDVAALHDAAARANGTPAELALEPGTKTTLRQELGRVLNHYNRESGGAILAAAADLLGSTSTTLVASGFTGGYYDARSNADARLFAAGGICEDAMAGILSGLSSFGRHVGVGSSYGAFIASLGHVAARLHAIGNQAERAAFGRPYRPMILVCAHAGVKTGEDGPTHADPQPLQLLQGNFPAGTLVTLTPWDPQEVFALVTAALRLRPAVIAPFVTRPPEPVLDRAELGLAPPEAARTGLYRLRAAKGEGDGVLVLQGSDVAYAFVQHALPRLVEGGVDLDVYYVASAELFDALPDNERAAIWPERLAERAMGITGFTRPTLDRWITSEAGRRATLHPFQKGHFLGSGPAEAVMAEAGLDGESQVRAIRAFLGQAVRG